MPDRPPYTAGAEPPLAAERTGVVAKGACPRRDMSSPVTRPAADPFTQHTRLGMGIVR